MKKAIAVEISGRKQNEDRLRGRMNVQFVPFKPRMETIPVYAAGGGPLILPGSMTFHKYNMIMFSIGADYRFEFDKLSFYPGADMIVGGVRVKYELHYETLLEEEFTGTYLLGGLRLRAGSEYDINEISSLFLEATRSMYAQQQSGLFGFNDIGLGFRYTF